MVTMEEKLFPTQEENYKIKERADIAVKKHGPIENALIFLKEELIGFENSWGKYSCDCLGHGIICNRLLIKHLSN